jgi:hypothetical protein
MSPNIDGMTPEGGSVLLVVLVALVALLTLLALMVLILYLAERKKSNLFLELLVRVERRHTQELLEQNKRFAQQLYNQQERSSLATNATVRQLVELWSKMVSETPES